MRWSALGVGGLGEQAPGFGAFPGRGVDQHGFLALAPRRGAAEREDVIDSRRMIVRLTLAGLVVVALVVGWVWVTAWCVGWWLLVGGCGGWCTRW